ncbi:formin-like protein CG32138 [Caerostris extrusa]|uniref:Formin-like protein CG32138 n=1 Tax=Caerostris extrusa TaxID=172846 RepID=A0AAV4XIS1_CAEEX|nr:formin-like protein CG32138 [Caerostris extrusa]
MVIELPKTTNARMGNAGSSRQSTLHQRFKQYPVDSMKMPMPEQNELEKRFTKVLVRVEGGIVSWASPSWLTRLDAGLCSEDPLGEPGYHILLACLASTGFAAFISA